MGKTNRTHTPAFKAQVALAAIKGDRTIVFAHLIQDEKRQEPRTGLRAREEFLRQFPSLAL